MGPHQAPGWKGGLVAGSRNHDEPGRRREEQHGPRPGDAATRRWHQECVQLQMTCSRGTVGGPV